MPLAESAHRETSMEQRLQMAFLLALSVIGIGSSTAGILGVTSFMVSLGVPPIGLRRGAAPRRHPSWAAWWQE